MTHEKISLKTLVARFWKKTILTWLLVILEGFALLLMPLAVGWAVDSLLKGKTDGIIQLGGLCMILLVIGTGRRFYDTRVYSGIYRKISHEMVTREQNRKTSLSKISARTNLFTEFIEFLENALPDILNQFLGLIGTLGIIIFIDIRIFWVCLGGVVLTVAVYILSQNIMFQLNKGQNDEFEKQIEVLSSSEPENISTHFRNLMGWNIKLSDLETINFSLTWIFLVGVLLGSILIVATSATASFGQVVTIIMYVFGFMENVMAFPLYYQQIIRLQEIATRLAGHPD